jgi:hypothetical protein
MDWILASRFVSFLLLVFTFVFELSSFFTGFLDEVVKYFDLGETNLLVLCFCLEAIRFVVRDGFELSTLGDMTFSTSFPGFSAVFVELLVSESAFASGSDDFLLFLRVCGCVTEIDFETGLGKLSSISSNEGISASSVRFEFSDSFESFLSAGGVIFSESNADGGVQAGSFWIRRSSESKGVDLEMACIF